MATRSTILFLTLILTSCAQKTNFDCSEVLDQSPYFMRHDFSEINDSIRIDLEILKSCGQLDSIDSELLKGPILGTTLVELASSGKKVTYHAIIDKINEFKKSEDYQNFREITRISKTLEHKIATVEQFEKDKALFMKLEVKEKELEEFKSFLEAHSTEKMTYKEAFARYMNSKPVEPTPESKVLQFADLIDLDHALKMGKENNKPVLIYFTCHACVSARKMEYQVLTNEQIKTFISDNFAYFAAYLDDKRPDKKNNSTVGKKYGKLQEEKFHSSFQPQFYIVDHKGEVLSEIGYTNKTDEFMEFLRKGLKQ